MTIVAHRAEMGTGIRTSLPMVIADELEADWARVLVVQAPGDEERYGNQDTDGSRSTRRSTCRWAVAWAAAVDKPEVIGALQPTPGERALLDTLCVLNAPWLMRALGLRWDRLFWC